MRSASNDYAQDGHAEAACSARFLIRVVSRLCALCAFKELAPQGRAGLGFNELKPVPPSASSSTVWPRAAPWQIAFEDYAQNGHAEANPHPGEMSRACGWQA